MPDELDLLGDRRSMRAGANGQRPMRAHASSTGNLIYHGGPVMAGNMKAYVIF
jgi:hypothetical protein